MKFIFVLALLPAAPVMAEACDISAYRAGIERAVSEGDGATGGRLAKLAIQTAVACAQAQSAQVQSAQVQSAQVQSAQAQSAQAQSAQVQSAQVQSAQVQSAQVQSAQVQSAQVKR